MRFLWYVLLVVLALGCRSDSESDAAENRTQKSPEGYLIVDASEQQLFGASRSGEWIMAEQAAEFTQSDQRYRLYGLTDTLGIRTAAAAEPSGETCTNPTVPLRNLPDYEGDMTALSGPWNALPRVPAVQDTAQDVYKNVVANHLDGQDVEPEDISLDQVLRVDLEGDGTEEVLIAANHLRGLATMALAGDYAVVLLRKLLNGEVRSIPLEEEYYPEECIAECAPSTYRISAVLDVNGDGMMEVVTGFQYFEGKGKRIHAFSGQEIEPVLSWRCGG